LVTKGHDHTYKGKGLRGDQTRLTRDETPLGSVHGRAANRNGAGDVVIANAVLRRQQDLHLLDLARRVLADAHQSVQLRLFRPARDKS
jgi:hypothetical protein